MERIPVLFSDGFTWKDAKPFITKDLSMLSPHLISLASRKGQFINSVHYFVIDKNTGSVWGGGKTQIEAINDCKRIYKKLETSNVLIDEINERILKWNVAWDKFVEEREATKAQKVVSIKPKEKLTQKIPKRALVFKKNNGKCFYCDDQLEIDAEWHIEHKHPKCKGGDNDLSNLVPAFPSCNLKKHSKTAKEFLEGSAYSCTSIRKT